jgi:hypothetical protein
MESEQSPPEPLKLVPQQHPLTDELNKLLIQNGLEPSRKARRLLFRELKKSWRKRARDADS